MKFKKVFIPQLPPNYFVLEFYDFVGSFKAAKWPKSSPARWRSIKLDSMDDAIRDCWRHYIANNFIRCPYAAETSPFMAERKRHALDW